MEEPTKIEVQDANPTVEFPAHGTELPNEHGTEVVVHDKDEDGNVIGWHKELKEKK